MVPSSAWFSVDRRFNADEDLDAELARRTGTIQEAAAGAEVDGAPRSTRGSRARTLENVTLSQPSWTIVVEPVQAPAQEPSPDATPRPVAAPAPPMQIAGGR